MPGAVHKDGVPTDPIDREPNFNRERILPDRRRDRKPGLILKTVENRQFDARTASTQGDELTAGHSQDQVFHDRDMVAGRIRISSGLRLPSTYSLGQGSTQDPPPLMNRESAIEPALISCSRCDGPVQAEDLVEGTAIRVDGQPVCPACIESLPAAIRLQIQRVRALKGLTVTTYRMAFPGRAERSLFTFTNAGLVLLHRRALVHGTEFSTPDLPVGGKPLPSIKPAPAKPIHWLIMGGVGAAVLIGVGLLIGLSGPKAKPAAPDEPTQVEPEPPVAVTPAVQPGVSEPPVTPVTPETAPAPAPTQALTSVSAYLQRAPNSFQALLAAETDGASADLRSQLEALVKRDRDTQLTNASRFLNGGQLDRAQKLIDEMPLAKDRPEFAQANDLETILRRKIAFIRSRSAEPPAGVTPPMPVPPPAPTPAPVVSKPAPAAASHPPASQAPAAPKPPAPPKPQVTLFTGPFTGSADVTPLDGKETPPIPSPWPTVATGENLLFSKAVKVRTKTGKMVNTITVTVPAAGIQGGGIHLLINRSYASRTRVQISFDDLPNSGRTIAFTDDNWLGVEIPTPESTGETVTIRIEDLDEVQAPFWLGQVNLVSNQAPTAAHVGLMSPGLLTPNVGRDSKVLLNLLKAAAQGRGAKKWFDPSQMPVSEFQILVSGMDKSWKADLYAQIKGRWKGTRNERDSVADFSLTEFTKLFAGRGGIPRDRLVVAVMPNGSESTYKPDEWTKLVLDLSEKLIRGIDPKKPNGGWLPVWVIGSTDQRKPVNPAQWEKLRAMGTVPLIDLTAAGTDQVLAARLLTDALQTLEYQLRWIQTIQAGK